MADTLTPGPHHRESEFVWDPDIGKWLTGTCGPCALAMAAWNATGKETHTLDVYRFMRRAGRNLCDVNGASTPDQLKTTAQMIGLTITEYQPYAGDSWPGWHDFLDRHAGRDVIVLELSHGQNLRDEISGKGENAVGLRYHYICGYGASGDGWLFADGANYAVGDVLQRYSFANLGSAMPCAAIAIHVPGGSPMAWTFESNGTAKDAKGHTAGAGFAGALKANPALAASDGLMSETAFEGAQTFLPLEGGAVLSWDGVSVHTDRAADVLVNVWLQLVDAKSAPPPSVVPLSPYQLAAIAAAEAQMAAQSALASATALKGK